MYWIGVYDTMHGGGAEGLPRDWRWYDGEPLTWSDWKDTAPGQQPNGYAAEYRMSHIFFSLFYSSV